MLLPRRTVIQGLISLVAAPAIVRVDSLMKLPRPEPLIKPGVYWLSSQDGFAYWGVQGPPSYWNKIPGQIAHNLTTGSVYVYDGTSWQLSGKPN